VRLLHEWTWPGRRSRADRRFARLASPASIAAPAAMRAAELDARRASEIQALLVALLAVGAPDAEVDAGIAERRDAV
jgi:hypothetical protein